MKKDKYTVRSLKRVEKEVDEYLNKHPSAIITVGREGITDSQGVVFGLRYTITVLTIMNSDIAE